MSLRETAAATKAGRYVRDDTQRRSRREITTTGPFAGLSPLPTHTYNRLVRVWKHTDGEVLWLPPQALHRAFINVLFIATGGAVDEKTRLVLIG